MRPDVVKHPLIVAAFILPEQSHGGIPGTVLAIEQPAIVGRIGEQDPGRDSIAAARCATLVSTGSPGRGRTPAPAVVVEIGEVGGQIDDVGAVVQHRLVGAALGSRCRLIECCLGVEECRHRAERDRPVVIVPVTGAAGPDEFDLQPVMGAEPALRKLLRDVLQARAGSASRPECFRAAFRRQAASSTSGNAGRTPAGCRLLGNTVKRHQVARAVKEMICRPPE